jgi:hypothetical protein
VTFGIEGRNPWKRSQALPEAIKNNQNCQLEFGRVKRAIPNNWKKILKGEDIEPIRQNTHVENNPQMYISHNKIKIKDQDILLQKLKSKDLYFHIFYPQKQANSTRTWQDRFQVHLDWPTIFKNYNDSIKERKRKSFHWKCLHRAIYSETRLQAMGRSDGMCKICKEKEETTCHLFYECKIASEVWKDLNSCIINVTNCLIELEITDVLFGLQSYEEKCLQQFIDFYHL